MKNAREWGVVEGHDVDVWNGGVGDELLIVPNGQSFFIVSITRLISWSPKDTFRTLTKTSKLVFNSALHFYDTLFTHASFN